MRFRLDAPHYIDDMYLEPGTEVGDGTGIPFRFRNDSNIVRPDGSRVIVKAGQPMLPSISMTPLDDEGRAMYRERFGETPPDRDPVERIPLMGNVKTSDNIQPSKSPIPGAVGPTAVPPNKPSAQAGPQGPVPGDPDNKQPTPGAGPAASTTPASPGPGDKK